jgi:hypothetical protein
VPTATPTEAPTALPTVPPTAAPTAVPTTSPSYFPTTATPTVMPTRQPTAVPTDVPTAYPTPTCPGFGPDPPSCRTDVLLLSCTINAVRVQCPAHCNACTLAPSATPTRVPTTGSPTTQPTRQPTPLLRVITSSATSGESGGFCTSIACRISLSLGLTLASLIAGWAVRHWRQRRGCTHVIKTGESIDGRKVGQRCRRPLKHAHKTLCHYHACLECGKEKLQNANRCGKCSASSPITANPLFNEINADTKGQNGGYLEVDA